MDSEIVMADDHLGSIDGVEPVVISREEARAKGLKRFFTGEPCKHGHVAERYVRDLDCAECASAQRRAWDATNQKRVRALSRAWEVANRESRNARLRARRAANREQYNAQARAYNAANRDRINARARARLAANREHANARGRALRAAQDFFTKRAKQVNCLARRRGAAGRVSPDDIRTAYFAHVDAHGVPRCGNRYLPCSNDLRDGCCVDHIDAIDRGGANVPENIQCLCPSCSSIKGSRTEEEFRVILDQDRSRYLAARAVKLEADLRRFASRFGLPRPRYSRRPKAANDQLDLFNTG